MSAAMAQPRIGRMAMARSLPGSGEESYYQCFAYGRVIYNAARLCQSVLLELSSCYGRYSGTCLVKVKGGL